MTSLAPQWLASPEWQVICASHRNVLIAVTTSTADEIDDIVDQLVPCVRQPVRVMREWSRSDAPKEGTLILRAVETLMIDAQRELSSWLDATGSAVQVISIASQALFPLVASNRFAADLYYRLNTIYVELDG